MFRKLPVLRTYAELQTKSAQLESAITDREQLRETLRAKTAELKSLTAEIRKLREQVAEVAAVKKALEKRDWLLEEQNAPVVSPRRLKRILRNGGTQQYQDATPFPHIVIEEFLHPGILKRVVDEFAAADRSGWKELANVTERKFSTEDWAKFGPVTCRVFDELNAGPFVTFLEQLTGINGVISDPHLRGGGYHEIVRGGMLGIHADFNHHKRLNIWRRLNLLIYLNSTWDESWGGHLELWDRGAKSCIKRIEPIFNRAVIFSTSNFSYHGHPHPLNCPDGEARRSPESSARELVS